MSPDIDQVLAYEIKKEIADRYFGFRKLIEEDKQELEERLRQQSFILEKRITFDLLRIYLLLEDDLLIKDFLKMSSLAEDLFYDRALCRSEEIKKRVFEGVRLEGFTHKGRFTKLLLECYERLTFHVDMYRLKFAELMELRTAIADEIRVFYRQNELGTIIGFMQSLGNISSCGSLEGGMEVGMAMELEKKMRIEPPLPIEQYLPVVAPLPDLKSANRILKNLASRAWQNHHGSHLPFLKFRNTLLARLAGESGEERRGGGAEG